MIDFLIFYPSKARTIQLETVILALHQRGKRVALLTTCERGPLHDHLAGEGIEVYVHAPPTARSLFYYLRQIHHLASFCRRHDVAVVFSNLQHANFIAAFAQFFTRARFVLFRHHFKFAFPGDEVRLPRSRTEGLFDHVINRLGRTIVVPSKGVLMGMLRVENADARRVQIVPYIYDFTQYGQPDADAVAQIRADHPARLLLVMSSRHIPYKRHRLAFQVFADLIREGYDIRVLVLDDGPERAELERFAQAQEISDRLTFLGFRRDFLDYLAAADLLVHPSLTEASSNVVKEVALLGRTAVVCDGVGDFSDYVEHGRTGYLVPRATDGSEIAGILRAVYDSPDALIDLGRELHEEVLNRFQITDERVERYLALARPARRRVGLRSRSARLR
ncbi:MAG: glycosyltransferase [Solirubrobacterales bacterium]|nr:glycosyltransferase [Solirubrobacterales bacterium]